MAKKPAMSRKTIRKELDKESRKNELAEELGIDKPKKGTNKKAPKQTVLVTSEGPIEDERIEEIEHAASNYVSIRDRRMNLTEDESEAKAKLMAAMKQFGQTSYRCRDGRMCEVIHGDDNVKVRSPVLDGSE